MGKVHLSEVNLSDILSINILTQTKYGGYPMIEVTEMAQEKLLEHVKSQDDAMAVRVMVTAG